MTYSWAHDEMSSRNDWPPHPIHEYTVPAWEVAERYKVTLQTVWRWIALPPNDKRHLPAIKRDRHWYVREQDLTDRDKRTTERPSGNRNPASLR